MDDELTPEQRFAAESAEYMVPRALMAGRDPADVVEDLVHLDWPRDRAQAMVARAIDDLRRFRESPESRQQLLATIRRQFFVGLGLMGIGAGLSALSLFFVVIGFWPIALVFYGLFFVGLATTVVNVGRWRFYRHAVPELPDLPAEERFTR